MVRATSRLVSGRFNSCRVALPNGRASDTMLVDNNRGRIALSPSQPGLNSRSSRDNRSYNCFFNLGDLTSSLTSAQQMAMTVPRLRGDAANPVVIHFLRGVRGKSRGIKVLLRLPLA